MTERVSFSSFMKNIKDKPIGSAELPKSKTESPKVETKKPEPTKAKEQEPAPKKEKTQEPTKKEKVQESSKNEDEKEEKKEDFKPKADTYKIHTFNLTIDKEEVSFPRLMLKHRFDLKASDDEIRVYWELTTLNKFFSPMIRRNKKEEEDFDAISVKHGSGKKIFLEHDYAIALIEKHTPKNEKGDKTDWEKKKKAVLFAIKKYCDTSILPPKPQKESAKKEKESEQEEEGESKEEKKKPSPKKKRKTENNDAEEETAPKKKRAPASKQKQAVGNIPDIVDTLLIEYIDSKEMADYMELMAKAAEFKATMYRSALEAYRTENVRNGLYLESKSPFEEE
jgi:outer membrane biosynthesis protein TonB